MRLLYYHALYLQYKFKKRLTKNYRNDHFRIKRRAINVNYLQCP